MRLRQRPAFILILGIIAACSFSAGSLDAQRKDMRQPHHTREGFRNPWVTQDQLTGEFFKWILGMGPKEKAPVRVPGPYAPPITEPRIDIIQKPDAQKTQVTWIGHATFLIQTGGLNILTDPIFSERASPVSFAGPKRHVAPGVPFESLPPIDVVVLSHSHYDHLDRETVLRLGNRPRYFVPLGLADWFRKQGIDNVVELDWWQSASFQGFEWNCVPAQHFSGRSPFDRNETLWAGWVIRTKKENLYFAGDTGYGPFFTEMTKRFGPMRFSMIPIGAYRPRWFMSVVHVDPREAVQVHLDVRSELSVGMHWGTFRLAEDALGEPPVYLEKAKREKNIPSDAFRTMAFGETITF